MARMSGTGCSWCSRISDRMVLAAKGQTARDQIVQHHADGVDVRLRAGRGSAEQLGCHEGRSSREPLPGKTQQLAGQPEIGELDMAVRGQEHVGGFDVKDRLFFTMTLKLPDPTGLQVLKKCRVSSRRHFCHPTSFQGRGCENGRSTEDPASGS